MSEDIGFWSYARADDDAVDGRITRLSNEVTNAYGLLTGKEVRLFVDREHLDWGSDWRATIDGLLAQVAFFIPVVTPRYFQRPECRRELHLFASRARRLGTDKFIMPIRYVDISNTSGEVDEPAAEAMALINRFQFVDWQELRLSAPDSPEYLQAVVHLARRLVDAGKRSTGNNPVELWSGLPALTTVLDKLTEMITALGHEAARTRQASVFTAGAREVADLITTAVDMLNDLDPPIVAALQTPDRSLVEFVTATDQALGATEEAAERLGELARTLPSARGAVRSLGFALMLASDGRELTQRWVRRLEV